MKGEDILFSAIVGCCLLIIGCGVGVTIIIDDFRNAIVHSPRGVVIGLISQCLFMPFCTYLMAVILDLPELQAAGLILVGCAPGGGFSNLLTLWIGGDVSLSVTMTTASTIFASFMIPLNVELYLKQALSISQDIEMDWFGLYYSLGMILVGTALGMCIRHYRPNNTKLLWVVELSASIVGLTVLFGVFIWRAIVDAVSFFKSTTWKVALGGCLIEPIALVFGLTFSSCAGLPRKVCQTISLETGLQNLTIVVALIELSFPEHQRDEAQQFPFMVAIIYFFWTFVALAIFRLDTLPEKIEDTDDLEEKAYTKVDLGEAGIEIVSKTVKEDNYFDKER